MGSSLFFPLTILDQFEFVLQGFLILLGVIVNVLANRTLQLDQIIL